MVLLYLLQKNLKVYFKMSKIYFFSVLITSFLICCKDSKTDYDDMYSLIRIDNTNVDSATDISSLVDTLSILLIKEPEKNYMADIFKMCVSRNGNYFFYDLLTNKVNAFDRNGYFIKTLCKAGDGPNDPLNITDFWITENNDIQVYDFAQMKVFNYDSTLNYKNSIKADQFNHFSAIEKMPNSKYYVAYANYNMYNKPYNDHLYQIALLNDSLNVFRTYDHFDKQFSGVSLLTYAQHFTRYKDTLRFYKAYDNDVYNVNSSGISKRYRILYNKQGLPDNVYPIIERHLPEFKNRSKRILINLPSYFDGFTRFNGHWYENDRFIHLSSFIHKNASGEVFFTILDKQTNQVLFNAKKFIEKKYKLQLPPFQYMDTYNNELIGIVNGKDLKNMLFQDSEFRSFIMNDPNLIYLIKVKLK
jgi:hypothetical protein